MHRIFCGVFGGVVSFEVYWSTHSKILSITVFMEVLWNFEVTSRCKYICLNVTPQKTPWKTLLKTRCINFQLICVHLLDFGYNYEQHVPSEGEIKRVHRRTQSLPPNTHHPAKWPNVFAMNLITENPVCKTYRFHSGLAGDINVLELMSESKLAFPFPQQLL